MKAILEFNLPEEQEDFDLAIKGRDWWYACFEMKQWLRQQTKHAPDDMSDDTYNALLMCNSKLHEITNDLDL